MDTIAQAHGFGAAARRAAAAWLLAAATPGLLAGQQVTAPARAPDVMFVPTDTAVVRAMLRVAQVGPEDLVYDLGCGDGRIVVTAVKRHGARGGVCVDIDPVRIRQSRHTADTAGVTGRIRFHEGDLFETDLRDATVVTLYLLPELNQRLRPKLFRELRPGSRVVSNAFDMGDWKPDSMLAVPTSASVNSPAYFWLIPADVAGVWKVSLTDAGSAGARARPRYEIRLQQRYQQLTGTAAANGRTVPLTGARLRGDRLSFTIRDGSGDGSPELRFTGRVQGNRMAGDVAAGAGDARSWSAVRTERGARPELKPGL